MNILWLTIDRSARPYKGRHSETLLSSVQALPDVNVTVLCKDLGPQGIRPCGRCSQLATGTYKTPNILLPFLDSNPDFDFIFCDAFFAYLYEDWSLINIPSAILIIDVHGPMVRTQIKLAEAFNIDIIFHRFNHAFHRIHKNASSTFKCIWLPHAVDLSWFNPPLNKLYNVILTGAYDKLYYPLRHHALLHLRNKPFFKHFNFYARPREGGRMQNPIYLRTLKQSKIHITCGSIFNAPVFKFFEIPAARCLLMSDFFPDLKLLGFEDMKNMVAIEPHTVVKKATFMQTHERLAAKIASAGYDLIATYHNSHTRAKQFISHIKNHLQVLSNAA